MGWEGYHLGYHPAIPGNASESVAHLPLRWRRLRPEPAQVSTSRCRACARLISCHDADHGDVTDGERPAIARRDQEKGDVGALMPLWS